MPEHDEIERKVLQVLKEELGPERPTLQADLATDYGMDSLDAQEIVLAVETAFDMEIPEADVEEMWTTGQEIVDYLVRRGQEVTGG